MIKHDEKWFAKQSARLREPFKNTYRYYFIPAFIFLIVYFVTKDYYHGWAQFGLSFLNISIFWRWEWSWRFMLTDIIPWIVLLALQVVTAVFAVKSIVNMFRVRRLIRIFEYQSSDYLGKAKTLANVGAPGVGKTFVAVNMAIVIAEARWQELQFDYHTQKAMVPFWQLNGDTDSLKAFEAIRDSYEFFKANESIAIPCLMSSVPIEDMSGRLSYVLDSDIFLQIERAPEYAVMLNDESGTEQGSHTSLTASDEVQDFWRFKRHFGDFINLNTEQGADGNGKYIRKSTDYNCRLFGQEWVLRPRFLLKLLAKQKRRFFKRILCGKYSPDKELYIGQRLYFFNAYIKTIGFRSIAYQTELLSGQVLEKGNYIMPARGIAIYNERSWREVYKAKDKPLRVKIWESLLVDGSAIRKNDELISSKATD